MKQIYKRLIAITAFAIVVSVGQKQLIQRTPNPYSNYIEQRENQLWNSLEKQGISRAEFIKEHEELIQPPKAKNEIEQNITPAIKQLFYGIASDFSIDPCTIAIQSVSQGNAEAWVEDQTMMINERLFAKLCALDQRFILAHELQHIIYRDHEDRFIFDELLHKKIHNTKLSTDLLNQFYRFQEERADVLAALKNPDYARAYENCMTNFLKSGDSTNPEHPKMSDRVKLAQQIRNGFGPAFA